MPTICRCGNRWHRAPRRHGDAGSAAEQEHPVALQGRPMTQGRDQVRPGHALGEGRRQPPGGPHQGHAVRHKEGGPLVHETQAMVLVRQHGIVEVGGDEIMRPPGLNQCFHPVEGLFKGQGRRAAAPTPRSAGGS